MPEPRRTAEIVLLAGRVRARGRTGHHDYAAGCRLLADLLARIEGVRTTVVDNGWPEDETVLDNAAAVVIYAGGNGKQAFLQHADRLARLQRMIAAGTGLVMLHQAVAFPAAHQRLGMQWLGGSYVPGQSRRGHWQSRHDTFVSHPVTRHVTPWRGRDGWLKAIQFEANAQRFTPILWSGKRYRGDAAGGSDDIVAWLYARADGGRSFAFTGLDNHRAWRHAGLRRLLANGVAWTAGLQPPDNAAWSAMSDAEILAYITPRRARLRHDLRKLVRLCRLRGRW